MRSPTAEPSPRPPNIGTHVSPPCDLHAHSHSFPLHRAARRRGTDLLARRRRCHQQGSKPIPWPLPRCRRRRTVRAPVLEQVRLVGVFAWWEGPCMWLQRQDRVAMGPLSPFLHGALPSLIGCLIFCYVIFFMTRFHIQFVCSLLPSTNDIYDSTEIPYLHGQRLHLEYICEAYLNILL